MGKRAGSDCKVCQSARQAEIDAKIVAGETSRKVSAWLAEVGESVSHAAVNRHAKNHITKRAARKAAAAVLAGKLPPSALTRTLSDAADAPETPEVTAMAAKIVEAATGLDEIARAALSVALVLKAELTAFDEDAKGSKQWRGATLAMANLFTGSLKAATDAIVARDEILNGGKKVKLDVDAKVSGGLAGLFSELEKQEGANGADKG